MMDKQLLAKVKALAEQGIGGEAENARRILDRLLQQHQMTIDEIESPNEKRLHKFRYKDGLERRLLNQIIYMVTGDAGGQIYRPSTNRHTKEMGTMCSEADAVEIQALFTFYLPFFKKELQLFADAFANKHHLFPPAGIDAIHDQEIDLEKELRISMMMMGMEDHERVRALPGK